MATAERAHSSGDRRCSGDCPAVSYPAPEVMAFIVGCAEIVFPVLLVLGLATRLAAFALLIMTVVVELTVPDGWPVHVTWAAMALGIMAWGPGRLSLDSLIGSWSGLDASTRETRTGAT